MRVSRLAAPIACAFAAAPGLGAQTASGITSAQSVSTRLTDSAPATLLPLTRQAAIDSALRHSARAALSRADSLVARATLATAREFANPTANLTYTRDLPHYHGILNVPFDYPWVRSARVRAARLGLTSASYRYRFERAAIRFDVDTAYTRALAATERSRLSRRNAVDADSLRQLAILRRDVGDASDMDVDLATVNAGQQANAAAADSLSALASRLDLQTLIGLSAERVTIALVDSLSEPDSTTLSASLSGTAGPAPGPGVATGAPGGTPATRAGAPKDSTRGPTTTLQVAQAEATLQAEQSALAVARRGVLGQPAFQAGVEGGDPGQPFPLPTFGLSIPFPLFNHAGGEIALATANRDRAVAELDIARRESAAARAQSLRQFGAALARLRRDRTLLAAANHVATRAVTSFAEGASALPNVLEAQRTARDALAQYIDDLAAANAAAAAVRLFTLTVPQQ